MLKMIICTDLDYGIGYKGKLLTYVPEDLAYFKKVTTGHSVVMGRKTWESITKHLPEGLPNRENVVISKTMNEDESNCCVIGDVAWIKKWNEIVNNLGKCDTFIIGGASIYEQFKDVVDEVHWTQLKGVFKPTDTFFDMGWVEDYNVFEQVNEEALCDLATVRVYRRK